MMFLKDKEKNTPEFLDYNGRITFDCIKDMIDKDIVYPCNTDDLVNKTFIKKLRSKRRPYNLFHNMASIISKENAEIILKRTKEESPNYDIKCVCSPLGELHLPYERISHEDFIEDLLYLIYSDVLIATKSTFAISSAFFHRGSKCYVNVWGHSASTGLGSKYDKSKITLF